MVYSILIFGAGLPMRLPCSSWAATGATAVVNATAATRANAVRKRVRTMGTDSLKRKGKGSPCHGAAARARKFIQSARLLFGLMLIVAILAARRIIEAVFRALLVVNGVLRRFHDG